ncbi:MAG: hypothetical protein DYG90_12900 [Chloroflexi bacterium CFX6]|nr:hypothetical protein [Chloroflexi bacterium CFX6]
MLLNPPASVQPGDAGGITAVANALAAMAGRWLPVPWLNTLVHVGKVEAGSAWAPARVLLAASSASVGLPRLPLGRWMYRSCGPAMVVPVSPWRTSIAPLSMGDPARPGFSALPPPPGGRTTLAGAE